MIQGREHGKVEILSVQSWTLFSKSRGLVIESNLGVLSRACFK